MEEAALDGRMKLRNMIADCLMVENGESIVFRAWRSGFCTWLTWPDYGFSFPRKVEEFSTTVLLYLVFQRGTIQTCSSFTLDLGPSDLVGQ
jgi:hypothetical protein